MAGWAFNDTQGDPQRIERVVGADPAVAPLWLYGARARLAKDPDGALAMIERGLQHHPRQADLLLERIGLLAPTADERLEPAIRAALGALPAAPVEAYFRIALVRTFLYRNELDAAEAELLATGGLPGTSTDLMADAWARLALSAEFLGQPARADACMDMSLDRGPDGRLALLEEVMVYPERQAAARSLRRRAQERHPGHPDLALAIIEDEIQSEEFASAEEHLATMPAPVPARLSSEVHAVKAHLALSQGRYDEGLEILRAQLRRWPGDNQAIEVLVGSWMQRAVPDDAELYEWLEAAWRSELPEGFRVKLAGLLRELDRRRAAGETTDPGELPAAEAPSDATPPP